MTSVTAPADRRFRRAHLTPARRRSRWRSLRVRAVLTIAVAGLTLYWAQRSIAVITGLDLFRLDRITVRGNKRLSTGEVQALLTQLGRHSILSIDLDQWRATLLNNSTLPHPACAMSRLSSWCASSIPRLPIHSRMSN